MHKIQEKLLRNIEIGNLTGMTLREIGETIEEVSPQKIKHHLSQLAKKGFIIYNPEKREIRRPPITSKEGLVSIPIVGLANCGPANIFADERVEGYLKVSKKIAPKGSKLFILRAEGNSMNLANINRKTIEDGDFVVVDSTQKNFEPNKYVVSVIDGMANIKKLIEDKKNKRIILKSESTQDYLPIFIHPSDSYHISGRVIDVIKK